MIFYLNKYITKDLIKVNVECENWMEVVREGSNLLEKKNIVMPCYKENILKCFEEFGPYMVVAPKIAILHARPEDGALKTSMSIIVLKNPVEFGNAQNDPVKVAFTFSSRNNCEHMELLSNLMKILMNQDDFNKLINSTDVEEVFEIVNKYNL